MSRDDDAERGRAEPIDVEYEPYREEPREGRGVGMGTALALAVVAAGVGAAGGAVAPRVPAIAAAIENVAPAQEVVGETPDNTAATLDARLDQIEALMNTPLAEAASGDAGAEGTAARVFALQAGLRDVEQRLTQMPSTTEVAALVTEVRRLQEELPAVAQEARAAATAARASYAIVAASEASRSSGPFEQAHAQLAALLPNDPNVAALEPLSRTGAPTRSELRDRFERLDNEIIRAARQSQAGAGFWGRIQAALAQWIIIRRADSGDTPEGIVARAEQALAGDQLDLAVQELNRLPEQPKRAAQDWINDARRRLEIDQRIGAIRQELSRS
ncbi:MAG TPA: mitofilin family membrane protein [Vitreimonas sp.]|uniref:COG4223 family protein n=1 Tax=Vitreimonas sp. TaxID=3069702 RepID=UPI002D4F669D|nr:mitofilin family membrane protein [Vitreimonas sp.]HYD89766.1 mitofilin family membrane protein [Vitreimonas sp.]